MYRAFFFTVGFGIALTAPAWGAGEGADAIEGGDGSSEETQPDQLSEELPRAVGEDQLANFVLQRGFFVAARLGACVSVGRGGTLVRGLRGVSDLQPSLELSLGYDIGDYLSVQSTLASEYVSGNPISDNDRIGAGGQETQSFALLSLSFLELVGAIRPTERFAIEPKFGGGLTYIYPSLTDPGDPRRTLSRQAWHVVTGVEFKYLTLLTDFSAGVALTGRYVIGPNVLGLAVRLVFRYTL